MDEIIRRNMEIHGDKTLIINPKNKSTLNIDAQKQPTTVLAWYPFVLLRKNKKLIKNKNDESGEVR